MTMLSCVVSLLLTLCCTTSGMAADMLMEDFTRLEAYLAKTSLAIEEGMPRFKDGYKQQEGKLDATGQALISHLKQRMPYPFKAMAGDSMVDVVQLYDNGKAAYVFIISKRVDNFIKNIKGNTAKFYYDLPAVMGALESFILSRKDMDKVLYIDKGSGYFMFVVQKK